ncbi:hypothetical protein D3C81_2165280 [compost metagenome]
MSRKQDRQHRQNGEHSPQQRGDGDNRQRPQQQPLIAVLGIQIAPDIKAGHHKNRLRHIQQRQCLIINMQQLQHNIRIQRNGKVLQQQPGSQE